MLAGWIELELVGGRFDGERFAWSGARGIPLAWKVPVLYNQEPPRLLFGEEAPAEPPPIEVLEFVRLGGAEVLEEDGRRVATRIFFSLKEA